MKKETFETIHDRIQSDTEVLIQALWNKKENNKHLRLLELIEGCHRGHGCCCDKQTEKACKKLEKKQNKTFDDVKDYFWDVEFDLKKELKP